MLIQKGNRTYSGEEIDLPITLPSGSIFISTDTKKLYLYDDTNSPILYSSGGSTEPISVTRSEVELLVSTNSLLPGSLYTITDADVTLYGGTEVTLNAITTNKLSLQGSGKFYCPKYDVSTSGSGYGIWSNYMEGAFGTITGIFSNNETVTANNGATAKYITTNLLQWISGTWGGATSITGATSGATCTVSGFVSPSYTIGQVVHWGGKSWTNLNGNVGTRIDKYTLDSEWSEIPFNDVDYNIFIDEIHYDFDNDMIIYRKDRYNNVVSGNNRTFVEYRDSLGYDPIRDFQWGCGDDNFDVNTFIRVGIYSNCVIDSYCETLNLRSRYMSYNKLDNKSTFRRNYTSRTSIITQNNISKSQIVNNYLIGVSSISYNTIDVTSRIDNNSITNNSSIEYNNILGGSGIEYNYLTTTSQIDNNVLSDGSTISYNSINSSNIMTNNLNSGIINNVNMLNNSNIRYNNINVSSDIGTVSMTSNSVIEYNTLSNDSSISACSLSISSNIRYNSILNRSRLSSTNFISSSFDYSTITNFSIVDFSGGVALNSKTLRYITCDAFNTTSSALNIDGATILVGTSYPKRLFNNSSGTRRLSYVDGTDTTIITNINT